MNNVYVLKDYYIALDSLLKILDDRLLKLETTNEQRNAAKIKALKILFEQLEDLRLDE